MLLVCVLVQAYEQMADLEREADQALNLQSRLELAINERDAAIAKAEGLTPRPQVRAFEGLTSEGTAKLNEALAFHRYKQAPNWTCLCLQRIHDGTCCDMYALQGNPVSC